MPCVVLPLMAIMKLFEWIFAKFFGKAQPAAEDAAPKKTAGCPFAAMGSSMPNPHTESDATTSKQVKQD